MEPSTDARLFPHGQLPGSLELAFVGDSVYDLHVRSAVTRKGGRVTALNRQAVAVVNAGAQARALERILPLLSDEEAAIARRAKNAKQTGTKNADPADYCKATALEAVLGYLYLTGKRERLKEILVLSTGMEGDI